MIASHDALNRTTNMVDAAGTTKYTYTAGGNVLTEDGPWTSDTVTYSYHATAPRLRTASSLQQPTGTWTNGFGYDAARRLTNVTSTAGTFSYAYKGVGTLVDKLALPNTSYITNTYDNVARLTGTYLKHSSNTNLNKHEYLYNAGNQRIRHKRGDDSYYTNTYDNVGQLKTAFAYDSNNTAIATQNRGYLYDAGWNLNKRTNNTTTYTFTVDSRNQIATGPAGNYSHDNNGNLTSEGTTGYVYDAENQLVTAAYIATDYLSGWKYDYSYDGRGRMRKRLEHYWTYTGGTNGFWTQGDDVRYVYDGMRMIQERSSASTPRVGYTLGSDLSGTLESAGGIGGLLARSHGYSSGILTNHNYYHADGGGNVTYMINSSQSMVASYKYDPYGTITAWSGSLMGANIYRFSSKAIQVSSGHYYYGYRFYSPFNQRWLNRDPLGESGGINLYGFVANGPSDYIDFWGLRKDPVCANQCHQDLSACYDAGRIAAAMAGGVAGAVTTAAGGVMGSGPHTTPGGADKKLINNQGKPTQYCKQLGKSVGGGFLAGAGVGILGLHAKCLGAFAGCMSGCPSISTVPSNPTPPMPPSMPFYPPYRP